MGKVVLICNKSKLHKVSEEVEMTDKVLVENISRTLLGYFYENNKKMQGLAAVQVGISKRAFLVRYDKDKEPDLIFNPKVLFKFGILFKDEGCLSEGTKRYVVSRPIFSIVEYQNKDGSLSKKLLWRKKTRIFMHELDHLNGKILSDGGIPIK